MTLRPEPAVFVWGVTADGSVVTAGGQLVWAEANAAVVLEALGFAGCLDGICEVGSAPAIAEQAAQALASRAAWPVDRSYLAQQIGRWRAKAEALAAAGATLVVWGTADPKVAKPGTPDRRH